MFFLTSIQFKKHLMTDRSSQNFLRELSTIWHFITLIDIRRRSHFEWKKTNNCKKRAAVKMAQEHRPIVSILSSHDNLTS